jgi:hypothetical protein
MLSPIAEQPGLLIRDSFRYSDAILVIPPPLVQSLAFFDGTRTDLELQTELTRSFEISEAGNLAMDLVEALSNAGFLEDETYARLKQKRLSAFAESGVREAAHAGSSYPAELGPLQATMQRYLDSTDCDQKDLIGIAAPHISPEGGWQCYREAYRGQIYT